MQKVQLSTKYRERQAEYFYKKYGNSFAISSTYSVGSIIWTYYKDTIEIHTLAGCQTVQKQLLVANSLPPFTDSEYQQINEDIYQKCLWTLDGDGFDFMIHHNNKKYNGSYPIEIQSLINNKYHSHFLNRIVNDMITYNILRHEKTIN